MRIFLLLLRFTFNYFEEPIPEDQKPLWKQIAAKNIRAKIMRCLGKFYTSHEGHTYLHFGEYIKH